MDIKPFHEYTKDELAGIYTELFGYTPCKTCKGVDWQGVYTSILKVLDKKNQKSNAMSKKKYIWNNEYIGYICFANGQPVKVGDEVEQEVMEIIFNNKKLLPLVLINPSFKQEQEKKNDNKKNKLSS